MHPASLKSVDGFELAGEVNYYIRMEDYNTCEEFYTTLSDAMSTSKVAEDINAGVYDEINMV